MNAEVAPGTPAGPPGGHPGRRTPRDDLRVDVLGVGVSCLDLEMAVAVFERWISAGTRSFVTVTGMHGVMESRRDPALRAVHHEAGMVTPDGMPMVWAAHRAGAWWTTRVYGPDLMEAVCARAAAAGWSMHFVGGAPGVAAACAERLTARFGPLVVTGVTVPPFRDLSPEEDRALVDEINAGDPDIVWVGLGTPKQEWWMHDHRERLRARVLVGVGAALAFHAGALAQAPPWMQRHGLEWLYRLVKEPRRLWRRYLTNIPPFVVALLRHPPRLMEGPSDR